jgi:cysteinyl-tRNA synthetase
MKKFIFLIIAVVFGIYTYATNEDTSSDKKNISEKGNWENSVIAIHVDSSSAIVLGKPTQIDGANSKVVPFIQNNRTYVPIRFVSEAFGAKVEWDPGKKVVLIEYDNKKIKLTINDKTLFINQNKVIMDVAPVIVENRTFIPVRYIAEAIDRKVYFNTGLIIISLEDINMEESASINIINSLKNKTSDNEALNLLHKANNWVYQLTDHESKEAVKKIIDSKFDIVVVDPIRTTVGFEEFDTKGFVQKIKNSKGLSGMSRKLAIAYINIGEAEEWRWYWKWSKKNNGDWPKYIIGDDPDGWAGNYPVAYWDKAWKDVVLYGTDSAKGYDFNSLVDQAIKDGFDGIYLDWVGGYDESVVTQRAKSDKVNAKKEMVEFLGEIRKYTKQRNKNFLVIQQNASQIYEGYSQSFDYIDAIAQEGVWYDGTSFDEWEDKDGADIRNDKSLSIEYLTHLKKYKEMGKVVLNVEYANIYKKEAYRLSRENGFIPYCSRRPLSQIEEE